MSVTACSLVLVYHKSRSSNDVACNRLLVHTPCRHLHSQSALHFAQSSCNRLAPTPTITQHSITNEYLFIVANQPHLRQDYDLPRNRLANTNGLLAQDSPLSPKCVGCRLHPIYRQAREIPWVSPGEITTPNI